MRQAEMLLAGIIAARATSFLFSKMLLADMGPFSLLGLRFLLAFAVLAVVFHRPLMRASRRALRAGCVLGAIFFTTMSLELNALVTAPSSTVSFLENLAIVLVPVTGAALLRRRPSWPVMVSPRSPRDHMAEAVCRVSSTTPPPRRQVKSGLYSPLA